MTSRKPKFGHGLFQSLGLAMSFAALPAMLAASTTGCQEQVSDLGTNEEGGDFSHATSTGFDWNDGVLTITGYEGENETGEVHASLTYEPMDNGEINISMYMEDLIELYGVPDNNVSFALSLEGMRSESSELPTFDEVINSMSISIKNLAYDTPVSIKLNELSTQKQDADLHEIGLPPLRVFIETLELLFQDQEFAASFGTTLASNLSSNDAGFFEIAAWLNQFAADATDHFSATSASGPHNFVPDELKVILIFTVSAVVGFFMPWFGVALFATLMAAFADIDWGYDADRSANSGCGNTACTQRDILCCE